MGSSEHQKKNAGYPSVDSWVLHAREYFLTLEALGRDSYDYLRAVIDLREGRPRESICSIYKSVTWDMVAFTQQWISLLSSIAQWGVKPIPLRLMLLLHNGAKEFPLNKDEHPHIWLRVTKSDYLPKEFAIAAWVKCNDVSNAAPSGCNLCGSVNCHYSPPNTTPDLQGKDTDGLVCGFAYRPYLAIPSKDAPYYYEGGDYCVPPSLDELERLHALLIMYHKLTIDVYSASNLLLALAHVIEQQLQGRAPQNYQLKDVSFVKQCVSPTGASNTHYEDPCEIHQLEQI